MNSKWIRFGKNRIDSEKCMICIPFAGSGASLFAGWQKIIGNDMEILPIQLPGREERIAEKPLTSISDVVRSIAQAVVPVINGREFVIFGHSMGGLIAYALTAELENEYGMSPKLCIISASSINICTKKQKVSEMNDEELIKELSSYGGMDEQLLLLPDYLKMYLDIIRNDYKIIEDFAASEKTSVSCPLRLYSGTEDTLIAKEDMKEWYGLTGSGVTEKVFEGDHFFIKKHVDDICKDVLDNIRNGDN
ncbi:MAG: thioesterase [Ruminococcus sp.]|nr:thioesterase [Ruminococcus sp.]